MVARIRTLNCSFVLSALITLALCSQPARAETLREKIVSIYMLGAVNNADFGQVDARCQALLVQYTSPQEQGEIYFAWVDIYTNSGGLRVTPEKTIERAKKALDCPLDPVTRLNLYCRWGDVLQACNAGLTGNDLAAARRTVVMPYLLGLKDGLKYNIPDVAPERPTAFMSEPMSREELAKYEEVCKAVELVILQEKLVKCRRALTSQIASLYSLVPFAEDEIRKLATDTLQDKKAVNKLMEAVERAMEARADKFPIGAPNPKEDIDEPVAVVQVPEKPAIQVPAPVVSDTPINIPASRPPSSRAWILVPVVVAIGVAAAAIIFIWKRRRNLAQR